LNDEHQLVVIERLRDAVEHIQCRLHFVATEPTHIHVLVSWRDGRPWQKNRTSLKRAITMELKAKFADRPGCGTVRRESALEIESISISWSRNTCQATPVGNGASGAVYSNSRRPTCRRRAVHVGYT
jgi:hypothetical protein